MCLKQEMLHFHIYRKTAYVEGFFGSHYMMQESKANEQIPSRWEILWGFSPFFLNTELWQ